MALGKKIRFEVFKRDNFTCGYCGSTPPKVVLEVDHIKPRAKQGKDDINNLITACFDCNRGKSDRELTSLPTSVEKNVEIVAEREAQVSEYYKFLKKIEKRTQNDLDEIAKHYEMLTSDKYTLSDKFKQGTVRTFLTHLNKYEIKYALSLANDKRGYDSEEHLRYFCGICWNWIKRPETKKGIYG